MATFTQKNNIYLGDKVSFIVQGKNGCYQEQTGIVQDISQLPDVFVEGFDVLREGKYNRWKRGIDNLYLISSDYLNAGRSIQVEYDENEDIEFVHKGDVGTKEFSEIIKRKHNG